MNYKLTTGTFEGSVIADNTRILDVAFSELDEDLQLQIREFGENLYPDLDPESDFPVSLEDLKMRYEESWESEETDEEVDLLPISKWGT